MGLRHEFKYGGTTRTIDGSTDVRLGNFEMRNEAPGGFAAASGSISPAEFAAGSAHYRLGAEWRVYDTVAGQYIWGGDLRDPESSAGVVTLTADGWGKRGDRFVDSLLFEDQNIDHWISGDQEPLPGQPIGNAYHPNARINAEVIGDKLVFTVRRFVNFHPNSLPAHTGMYYWLPGVNLKRIEFDIAKNANAPAYTLQLVGTATGPTGALSVITSWSLDAGGPTSVNYSIAGSYDLIGLRIVRTTAVKHARHRRFQIKNLKVGGIATTSVYTVADGMLELFTRMGVASTSLASTSQSMLPYMTTQATLGQVADDICSYAGWTWRIDIHPSTGVKVGVAGPPGASPMSTWNLAQTAAPVTILPAERFNKVRVEYTIAHGSYTLSKTVAASPNPFPGGYDSVFQLDWNDPPSEAFATAFAQVVANELSLERHTGTATFSQVKVGATPYAPTVVRPGDKLILDNYGSKEIIIKSLSVDESGAIVEVELSDVDPTVEMMLSNRERRLNAGLSPNAATLFALDPNDPAVPANVLVTMFQSQRRHGRSRYYAYVDWDAVEQDIDGEWTWVNGYEVRFRPTTASGASAPHSPSDFGGLKVWYDAKKITGLADNDPVTTWKDASGNASHATGAGATRPTYKATGGPNSLPTVRFDGTQYLENTDASVASPSTSFVVMKARVTTSLMTVWDGIGSANRHTVQITAGNLVSLYAGTTAADSTGTVVDNTPVIITALHKNGNSDVWLNGVDAFSSNTAIGSDTMTGVTLGAREDRGVKLDGDITELIIFNRELSARERKAVQYYLRNKYSLGNSTDIPDGPKTWQTKKVGFQKDGDDTNDTPTEVVFKNLDNPHKWYYTAQVRAFDLLRRHGAWSAETTPQKPAFNAVAQLENIAMQIDPHKVVVTWDYPDDPDDPTLSHPDIHHVEVQFDADSAFTAPILRWDKFDKGQHKIFRFSKPLTTDTYYTRVRTHDVYGNSSPWLPQPAGYVSGQMSSPTAVLNPVLTFDTTERDKHVKFRAKCTFDELSSWEDLLTHYQIWLYSSDDGTTWTADPRPKTVTAKRDDDAGATNFVVYTAVRRRRFYKFKVRAIDVLGRKGAWSADSNIGMPLDSTAPPTPLLVTIGDTATDRVVLKWDDPLIDIPTPGTVAGTTGTTGVTGTSTSFITQVGAGSRVKIDNFIYTVKTVTSDTVLTLATNLSTSPTISVLYLVEEDPDVAFYQIQITNTAGIVNGTPDVYNTVYARDRSRGNRKSFRIPAADKGTTYYGRVRSVDASYNKSLWVAGTSDVGAGNSSTTVAGSGVVIGSAGGKTKVVWHVMGRLRVLSELQTHDYDMDEGMTLTKLRIRVKEVALGQAVKITPYKNGVALAQTTLAAGDRRMSNDAYNTAFADTDRLSFSVDQVGTTFPGRQLTVIAVFVP